MDKFRPIVNQIAEHHFRKLPTSITRMKVGLANDVYRFEINSTPYVLRLNQGDEIKGSSKFIPLFTSLCIPLPKLIAEDFTQDLVPFNWQIQSCLPGQDLGLVIDKMTFDQLEALAKDLSEIIQKLAQIQTDGTFGWVDHQGTAPHNSWLEFAMGLFNEMEQRNRQTGVIQSRHLKFFERIAEVQRDYFEAAISTFYYDDMSSKNVMVHQGSFIGLVDLDGVSYGDFLEAIGRIKAGWLGTQYGDHYTQALAKCLELTEDQQQIVTIWAFINRLLWQSEIGIEFNANTQATICPERVNRGEQVLDALIAEMPFN